MLTLTPRPRTADLPKRARLDLGGILPEMLAKMTPEQVLALSIGHGNRASTVADWFVVMGDPSDLCLRIEARCADICLDRVAAGMTTGKIEVVGNVGDALALEATGGTVSVSGDAGDDAAAGLRGGIVRVRGSVGDRAGASLPGQSAGMRGGFLLVDGNAGADLGRGMRRGTIAVAGDVGPLAGYRMIAGTLLLGGTVGEAAGAGMRRGTIALLGPGDPKVLPSFARGTTFRPAFLMLYLRELQDLGFELPLAGRDGAAADGRPFAVRRFLGDRTELGKGEILVPL